MAAAIQYCPNCSEAIAADAQQCRHCGYDLETGRVIAVPGKSSHTLKPKGKSISTTWGKEGAVDSDYGTLRFIGSAAKNIGRFVIAVGFVGFLGWLAVPFIAHTTTESGVLVTALISGMVAFISGLIIGGVLIAWGELIHLFINMAESSEQTAAMLEKAMASLAPRVAPQAR